ncbi:MAG: hypothetical protein AB9891_04100 [Anaerolineaceae bacterium]
MRNEPLPKGIIPYIFPEPPGCVHISIDQQPEDDKILVARPG